MEIPVKSGQGVILSRSSYLLSDRLAIRELEGVWWDTDPKEMNSDRWKVILIDLLRLLDATKILCKQGAIPEMEWI